MQEKKAVTRQVRSRYLKAGRKEKSDILNEFIKITGYKNRKYERCFQVIVDWHRNPACPIPFTRSRDHKKNDNCFVEQKNGAVVREYIGYDRLEGEALQTRFAEVYRSLVPLLNFFMPTMKLQSKVKVGSKEIKTYDAPRSPYQRLPESDARLLR